MKLYETRRSIRRKYIELKKSIKKYLVKTGLRKRQEYFTVLSIHRDNLRDIGVIDSDNLDDETMEDIASEMWYCYDNYRDEETYMENLETIADNCGLDRQEDF